MKRNHTPGTWSIGKHGSTVVSTEKVKNTNFPSAVNPKESDDSDKEYYGGYLIAESIGSSNDANLIAAAPDLIDACETAIEALEWYRQERFHVGDGAIGILKKAILKAQGESSNPTISMVENNQMPMSKEWPESSMIGKTEYDPETLDLIITFKNGKRYRYSQVPDTEWRDLLESTSIGKYINAKIKGHYPSVGLDDPAQPLTIKTLDSDFPL